MNVLASLHRWAGGLLGLLLAVVGFSGATLVWEEYWLSLPGAGDPIRGGAAHLGEVVAAAMAERPGLSRVTFADEGMGLHQAIYADGSGAYLNQAAQVIDRWDTFWGRPELWLFELHHYLFLGKGGEYVTGTLGLLLLAFVITGLILWWRTRETFKFRMWPKRMTKSAIVRHHRDVGVVASPLLLMAAITGSLMVFPKVSDIVLTPWADPAKAAPPIAAAPSSIGSETDWSRLITRAQDAFPTAAPRRLMLPSEPGKPLTLRLRQPFEWTPNGRTYVYLDPASAEVLAQDDPAARDTASAVVEKFYPVHAGKVGGVMWRLALTFSGLALTLLGALAAWSFWFASSPLHTKTRSN